MNRWLRASFLAAGLGLGMLAFHFMAVYRLTAQSTLPQASPDPGGSAAPPGSSP